MQFREFGEWITRIADVHGDTCYTIYVPPGSQHDLVHLISQLGIQDRFEIYTASALAPGRMEVIAHRRGTNTTLAVQPFSDALQAALRADFPQQIFEATAEAMANNEPFRVVFHEGAPEEFSATRPFGDSDSGG